ncbi:MAG: hypothetical protein JWQ03_3115 [Variovorax sp.]|nr:hypothetical protein [Variovorax sp.]
MKGVGMTMWVVGMIAVLWAMFVFDPSVAAEHPFSGGVTTDRVVNMDLQQRQLLMALAGMTAFISGIVVHCLAMVMDRMSPVARPAVHTPVAPIPTAPHSDASDQEVMERHGIRREGDYYIFDPYRYEHLKDAVAYATKVKS